MSVLGVYGLTGVMWQALCGRRYVDAYLCGEWFWNCIFSCYLLRLYETIHQFLLGRGCNYYTQAVW